MKCENKTAEGRCEKEATHNVEKHDLSHRVLHLCEQHVVGYRAYPDDFLVSEIKAI